MENDYGEIITTERYNDIAKKKKKQYINAPNAHLEEILNIR